MNLDINGEIARLTLGGPSGVKTLHVCGTVLTLASASAVNTNGFFNLCGGTLNGTGSLTVRGMFDWKSGTIGHPAWVSITSNAVLHLSGPDSRNLHGPLTNGGAVVWTGLGDLRVYNNNGANYSGSIHTEGVVPFRNRQLRPLLAQLLGIPESKITPGRMSYDLRRLRLHGLIQRQPKSQRYRLSDFGLKTALFYSRVFA